MGDGASVEGISRLLAKDHTIQASILAAADDGSGDYISNNDDGTWCCHARG